LGQDFLQKLGGSGQGTGANHPASFATEAGGDITANGNALTLR
jgi:hypothetical protein